MKLVTVVGARPQFIKAAIVSQRLREMTTIRETLVHTGQHYDDRMSRVFFDQLPIRQPKYNLHVGSGSHGWQTGSMMIRLEEVLLRERPDAVLIYGDTNSTLAAALTTVKLDIPVLHVEAGLRSYRRSIPEEVNRVATDHVSSLLFAPTRNAVTCLQREGISSGVHQVGDVMHDCVIHYRSLAERIADPLAKRRLAPREYLLLTCHRPSNTDKSSRLASILDAVNTLSGQMPVVFPAHPRTRAAIRRCGLHLSPSVHLTEPASYLEMLQLTRNAALIMTDSGGLQKEAWFCQVRCVTLRDETEWNETIEVGANVLAGWDTARIIMAAQSQLAESSELPDPSKVFGDGNAASRIVKIISNDWKLTDVGRHEHLDSESLCGAKL